MTNYEAGQFLHAVRRMELVQKRTILRWSRTYPAGWRFTYAGVYGMIDWDTLSVVGNQCQALRKGARAVERLAKLLPEVREFIALEALAR